MTTKPLVKQIKELVTTYGGKPEEVKKHGKEILDMYQNNVFVQLATKKDRSITHQLQLFESGYERDVNNKESLDYFFKRTNEFNKIIDIPHLCKEEMSGVKTVTNMRAKRAVQEAKMLDDFIEFCDEE